MRRVSAVSHRTLDGYESDSTLVYHRNEPPTLTSGEQRSYYNQIQRGGDVPLSGLRKPAPERPKGQLGGHRHIQRRIEHVVAGQRVASPSEVKDFVNENSVCEVGPSNFQLFTQS